MTLLVCNQTQIETVKTASVESIIQTRERADSYSVMIDDDDASRSIDRSFDNSNNSSTMMIDPISLQSQADNLLMKLNQASSHTSSTFTSSVSDETTTNDYNENNNGHQNYEDHNRTNGTTITTASKRMACVDNTNNTNPIIPSSFDSSTTCTSSIMHRDREHDLDNASSDSNSNSNSNNPLFDMYVQLKMKRQQMEEEEEEELQQQACARQHQGPTGLVGPLVLSEGGGTTTGRDHNNQDCIIDATTKASSLLDADSSMSTSTISHMVMKSNDNFNEMMHTSLPTNFNWMNTNYNNTSSFCNFNPITDDGNDDIGNSFTGDLTTTCGTTDTTYNNNYSNSFAFNGNSTSNNGTSTSTSISNGNCNNDNNNFIANSHININNNNENNNFQQQQQPSQIQLQDFSNLTTEQLREMIMIGTTEMTNLTTTNKRENSSDRGTCSSSSLDGSGIINSGIDNGSIGGNNNQLFAGSSISGRSNSTPVLHTSTSITASNNPFLQNLSVMDYRNKKIKISTTPSTGDGGGIGIGICGSSSSTANATFLSSTTYNNNSEQNQEEKDDDADPICCPQEQEQMMMMEQEESSSSAMVVADESATEISGMILAPWSEHASKLFSDLMEESKEEERLKKVALRMKPKDKPKRPLSAYNLFFKEERNRILESENKNDDPATNLDSSSYSDSTGFESLAKVIGSRWQKLVAGNDDDDDEASRSKMAVYKTKASIDMERYKGEMNIWNLKNGRTTTNKNDKSKSKTTRRYSGGPRIRKTSNKGIRKIRNTNNKKNNSNVDMDLSSKPVVDRPLSSGHDDDDHHHQQQQQQHQERRKSTGEDFINNVVATRTPFKWGTLDPGLFQLTNTEAHNNDNIENEIELTLQEV